MNWLTKQEQLVIGIIAFLLLTGLVVKHHRADRVTAPLLDEREPASFGHPVKP